MKGWEIFWLVVIIFSIISFTYISVVALIKGVPELKSMFTKIDAENEEED
jgi:hypothetical protein